MFAIIYQDDVQIFSHSMAEHKMYVDSVLKAMRAANLQSKKRKRAVGATETSCVRV